VFLLLSTCPDQLSLVLDFFTVLPYTVASIFTRMLASIYFQSINPECREKSEVSGIETNKDSGTISRMSLLFTLSG
jgi:hypothetical protein